MFSWLIFRQLEDVSRRAENIEVRRLFSKEGGGGELSKISLYNRTAGLPQIVLF